MGLFSVRRKITLSFASDERHLMSFPVGHSQCNWSPPIGPPPRLTLSLFRHELPYAVRVVPVSWFQLVA